MNKEINTAYDSFHIFLVLIVLATCFLPLPFLCPALYSQDPGQLHALTKARSLYNVGIDYFNNQDYQNAISNFEQAKTLYEQINHNESIVNCLKLIGTSHQYLENFDASINNLQKALQYFDQGHMNNISSKAEIYQSLAWAYYSSDSIDNAIQNFKSAQTIYKKTLNKKGSAESIYGLGQCYLSREMYASAMQSFNKAGAKYDSLGQKEKQWTCQYYVGKCLIESQDYAGAIPHLESVIPHIPDNLKKANCYVWSGDSHRNLEQFKEAIEAYKNALNFLNGQPSLARQCNYYIGDCYFQEKNWSQAIKCFQKVEKLYDNVKNRISVLTLLGHAYFNSKQYENALQTYQKAESLCEANSLSSLAAKLFEHIGDACKAQQNDSLAAESYKKSGEKHAKAGEGSEAARLYGQAGEKYFKVKNYASAITVLQESLQQNDDPGLRFTLAEALRRNDNFLEAITHYTSVLNSYNRLVARDKADSLKMARCYRGRGQAFFDRKEYTQAFDNFSPAANIFIALSDSESAAQSFFGCGISKISTNELDLAIKNIERARDCYLRLGNKPKSARCYRLLSETLNQQDQESNAIVQLKKAINITNSLEQTPEITLQLADDYNALGNLYLFQEKEDLKSAERAFLKAKKIFEQADVRKEGWANSLKGLAIVCFRQNLNTGSSEYSDCVKQFQSVADIFLNLQLPEQAARCFEYMGHCDNNSNNFTKALQNYKKAQEYYTQQSGEANVHSAGCHVEIGNTYINLSDENGSREINLDSASTHFTTALDYYQLTTNHQGLFKALLGIGDFYTRKSVFDAAENKYQEALEKHAPYVDIEEKVRGLQKLLILYMEIPDFQKALALIAQIKTFKTEDNDPCQLLTMEAEIFERLDNFQKADSLYAAVEGCGGASAKAHRRQRNAKIKRANMLLLVIGNKEKARQLFNDVLALSIAANDSDQTSACYTGLGNVYFEENNFERALSFYNSALTINQAMQDYGGIASVYINLGNIQRRLESLAQAQQYYLDAQQLGEKYDYPEKTAKSLHNLAIIDVDMKNYRDALAKFARAAKEAIKLADTPLLISIYSNMGVVYERIGKFEQASQYYNKAIDFVEHIRKDLSRETLVNSFIENNADLYNRIITLLINYLNKPEEALTFIERSRSQSLFANWKKSIEASDNTLLKNLLTAYEEAKNKVENAEEIIQEEYAKPAEKRSKARIDASFQIIAKNNAEIRRIEEELMLNDPNYAKMVPTTVAQLFSLRRTSLPDNAVVALYYPTDTKLIIYCITKNKAQAYSANISRQKLYDKIRNYHSIIENGIKRLQGAQTKKEMENALRIDSWKDPWISQAITSSQELYNYLIKPFETEAANAEQIIFIPSGLLHYVPFQALVKKVTNGQPEFVIEDWTVSYLNRFTRNDFEGRENSQACKERILALGNSHNNLPGVNDEMESLREFAPSPPKIFLRSEATEKLAKSLGPQNCIFVISDHVRINLENPTDNYIQLNGSRSDDGYLYSREIENIGFQRTNFVFLPNCQTAIGNKNPIVSVNNLVESFNFASVQIVLATLWPVSDYTTPKLMHEFYRNFLRLNNSAALSLRSAQLKLLKDPFTKHPFYWAGYSIYGFER